MVCSCLQAVVNPAVINMGVQVSMEGIFGVALGLTLMLTLSPLGEVTVACG